MSPDATNVGEAAGDEGEGPGCWEAPALVRGPTRDTSVAEAAGRPEVVAHAQGVAFMVRLRGRARTRTARTGQAANTVPGGRNKGDKGNRRARRCWCSGCHPSTRCPRTERTRPRRPRWSAVLQALQAGDEDTEVHPEGTGKTRDGSKRRVALPRLQRADIGAIDPGLQGQGLLRPTQIQASGPDPLTEFPLQRCLAFPRASHPATVGALLVGVDQIGITT